MRYYYDQHDAECHAFNYTGCGGNDNNFRDYEACMSVCRLPGESGAGGKANGGMKGRRVGGKEYRNDNGATIKKNNCLRLP